MDASLIDFLSKVPIFKSVSKKAIATIASELSCVHVDRGQILFKESDPADCLYLILSGRVRLIHKGVTHRYFVAKECGRGDVIGDMALVLDEPRIMTAKAVTACELLKLDKKTFEENIEKLPTMRAMERRSRWRVFRGSRRFLTERSAEGTQFRRQRSEWQKSLGGVESSGDSAQSAARSRSAVDGDVRGI